MKRVIQSAALAVIAITSFSVTSCGNAPASSGANAAISQGKTARLKLHNKYYTDMVVRLEGPEKKEVSIPARSNRSVQLKPGVYQYISAVRGFRPVSRYKVLEAGRSYAIQF